MSTEETALRERLSTELAEGTDGIDDLSTQDRKYLLEKWLELVQKEGPGNNEHGR